MKRLALIVAVVALGAIGCGAGTSDTTAKPAAPRKLRIALIPKALDIPVFTYANEGAQRTAKELGDVEVIYRGPEKADELKQKEIMESFISQKVDGIAISVLNAEAMRGTIDRAVDAGIPVITWDSDAPASKRIAFYGVDDFKSGQIMGQQAGQLLNGKGTVALLTSLGAHNLQQRLEGVKEALKAFPGITIVDTFDIKEDSMRCQELIETGTNRYPNLGAWISVGGWPVFSANALKVVDPKKTKFISFDTVESAIDLLKAGKVQVLLGQKYFGWGSEPVKMLVDLIRNGTKPPMTVIDSGVDVVTAANADEYAATFKRMENGGK
jgi:ribose transport system substrate-binding protein